jgi:hypothetical protein
LYYISYDETFPFDKWYKPFKIYNFVRIIILHGI